MMRQENKVFRTFRVMMVILICLMCVIPFYILLVLSLNSPSRIYYEGNIFIPSFDWSNYATAWEKSRIGLAMINSGIITFGTLGLTIVLGGMAGYAIARHNTTYVIVARWGGDEFIIFIKGSDDPDRARAIAREIAAGAEDFVKMPGDEKISVSMGIALYHGEEKNYSDVFKKADIALYKTKAHREVKFSFYEE